MGCRPGATRAGALPRLVSRRRTVLRKFTPTVGAFDQKAARQAGFGHVHVVFFRPKSRLTQWPPRGHRNAVQQEPNGLPVSRLGQRRGTATEQRPRSQPKEPSRWGARRGQSLCCCRGARPVASTPNWETLKAAGRHPRAQTQLTQDARPTRARLRCHRLQLSQGGDAPRAAHDEPQTDCTGTPPHAPWPPQLRMNRRSVWGVHKSLLVLSCPAPHLPLLSSSHHHTPHHHHLPLTRTPASLASPDQPPPRHNRSQPSPPGFPAPRAAPQPWRPPPAVPLPWPPPPPSSSPSRRSLPPRRRPPTWPRRWRRLPPPAACRLHAPPPPP